MTKVIWPVFVFRRALSPSTRVLGPSSFLFYVGLRRALGFRCRVERLGGVRRLSSDVVGEVTKWRTSPLRLSP
jgi:hypothetical protein